MDELTRLMNETLSRHYQRFHLERGFEMEPDRWRYFKSPDGYMFCWNTTPIEHVQSDTGEDDDAVVTRTAKPWMCWVMEPHGPGSRSGKAQRWREREGSRSRFKLRKDAKAEALRLLRKHKAAKRRS